MQPTLYAYIKNKTVFYHFIPFSHLPAMTISAPLGQGIINFIWPDSEQESTVFKIIKYLVDNHTDEKSYNNLIFNTLSPLARRSPFLFFVADAFLSYQMNLASANTISTFLNLFPNTDKYNFTDIQKDVENWLYSTKKDLDNELTYLLTEKTGENHLSPIQKLYLLSINNNSPFSHLKNLNFKTCLMPTNAYVPNSFSDALETFETENPEVIEMYCLHTFNELISFEFSQMLLHNINYKKCKCCG